MNGLANIFRVPELRRRIFMTLILLAVYRIGCYIPVPGIDREALAYFFQQAGGIIGLFNLFAGGALKRLSIFALGIMPYISTAIIMELLTVIIPELNQLKKEGEYGRRKINQYVRYGTVLLSFFQGFGLALGLEAMHGVGGAPVVLNPGWGFRLITALTLATGTTFLMWLGEQITERGIGNGISLIIFAGIVAGIPQAFSNTFRLIRVGEMNIFFGILIAILALAVVAFVVFMETSYRRIPIQYAKRIVGRRIYGGQSAFLPLKLNTSGVIPPIFASSLLMFPVTVTNFIRHPWADVVKNIFSPTGFLYNVLYIILIIFFCYFYTAIIFNPVDVAENMKKYGGFIPGIRPGKPTAEYIDRVLSRITLVGGLYLSLVCVLPSILIGKFHVPFYLGGTALLIVVGVALDTLQQIEAHLLTRQYETLIKGIRIRGRR